MSSAQAKSNQVTTESAATGNEIQDVRLPPSRYVLFFALAATGAVADLVTKSIAFANYFNPDHARAGMPQSVHWWVDQVFGLQTSTNPGALFGFGKGYSLAFAVISIIALIGIVLWLFCWKRAHDRWLTFALGLITAGIIGNLYDRLGFGYVATFPIEVKTHVRDWILFRLEGVPFFDPWPNFNIADSMLVCGAIMLFLHAFFAQPPDHEPVAKNKADSPD